MNPDSRRKGKGKWRGGRRLSSKKIKRPAREKWRGSERRLPRLTQVPVHQKRKGNVSAWGREKRFAEVVGPAMGQVENGIVSSQLGKKKRVKKRREETDGSEHNKEGGGHKTMARKKER